MLYDNLSGLETLRFFARLKGPAAKCGELLERVGLLARPAQNAVRERFQGHAPAPRLRAGAAGRRPAVATRQTDHRPRPGATRRFFAPLEALRDGVTIVISSHVLAEMQNRSTRWPC